MSILFRRVWHLLNRRRFERELLQEMSDHRSAMDDPSRFGDSHRLLEQSRDAWGWNWLDDALQDLTLAVRGLAACTDVHDFWRPDSDLRLRNVTP